LQLCAVLGEPGEHLVDVVHGEHDAEVAETVHRGVPVIGELTLGGYGGGCVLAVGRSLHE
jgi:hypothetical protein